MIFESNQALIRRLITGDRLINLDGGHELINPNNPRSGVYLASFTSFGTCRMAFAAYARNEFKGEETVPRGLKVCLKIQGNDKAENTANFVGLEIELDRLSEVLSVLKGHRTSIEISIARPGKPVKRLELKNQGGELPVFVKVFEGESRYQAGLSLGEVSLLEALIQIVLKVNFPDLSSTSLMQSFADPRAQVSVNSDSENKSVSQLDGFEDDEIPFGEMPQNPDVSEAITEQQSKAVYAICLRNGYGPNDKKGFVDQLRMYLTKGKADELIKRANGGDLSVLSEYEQRLK